MRKVSAVAIIILLGCVSAWAFAQVAFPVFTTPNLSHSRIDTYLSNATWTAPAGVTQACPELWGAGGGGTTAVGGGGGGAYALKCEAVTPGTGYAVVVGTGAANTDGGDTTFNSTDVVAKGGKSGTNGGAGGAAASSTGTTKFSGGAGRVNAGNSGGGGGAGTTQNGGTSSSSSGGTPGDFFGGTGGFGNGSVDTAREYASGGDSTASTQLQGKQGAAWINYQWAPGPGYPTVVARAAGRSGASATTSHVITLPSGTGGMLAVFFTSNSNIAISSITAGWTNACSANSGVNGNSGTFFYKLATGSDALTITMASAVESVHISLRITGTSVIPPCATANSVAGTPSANSAPPSLTYSGGTAPIYWIAARLGDLDTTQTSTMVSAPPSGYYDFQYLSSTTNTGTGACCDLSVTGKHVKAATEHPGAFTSNVENWVTITAAFIGTSPIAGVFAPGSYSWWIYPIARQVGAYTYANYVGQLGQQQALNLDAYGNYSQTDTFNTGYTVDEHGAPAVQALNDGNLLWAWSGHNIESKIWYYKSSGTAFPAQSAITATSLATSNVASYAQLITRSDSVWWFYRVNNGAWGFRLSTDNAATWAAEQLLWTAGATQIYMAPRKTDADTLRVLVTQNGGDTSNHIWVAKINLSTGDISSGSGSLGNLSGTSLPITNTALSSIYDAPSNYGVRLLDFKDDGSAFTYVSFDLDDSPFDAKYYMARLTGADPNNPAHWTHTFICNSGHEFYISTSHYFGGVVYGNDPHSGLRLYVSREDTGTWYIERWDSANSTGSDWVTTQLDSSAINFLLRPESPIGATANFPVYWQQGPSYTSFTVFNLNVVDR